MKHKFDIGNTLRKYRYANEHSQQVVADLLEISRTSYKKWEKNEIDFKLSQLFKIADIYETTVQQILYDSDRFRRDNILTNSRKAM